MKLPGRIRSRVDQLCGYLGGHDVDIYKAGWLTLIKALVFLFLPADVAVGFVLGGLHYEHLFYLYAAMYFVFDAYLTYGGSGQHRVSKHPHKERENDLCR